MRRYWHPIAAVSELEGKVEQARPPARRGPGAVQGQAGPLRPDHRAVPAPPRVARLRHPDRRRHPLPLSRLGVRPRRRNASSSRTSRRRARSSHKVKTPAYSVEEMGGVFWAYIGPAESKPLLPRIDGFVPEGTIRMLGRALIPVNWLQIMENSLDPIHTEWLHGHTYEFIKEQKGQGHKVAISARHEKIAFREFDHGITKHRLLTGHSEDCDDWKVGHPMVFPNILSVGNGDESRLALLRVPDPRAGGRHPHPAPVVHGLRAAEGRQGAAAPARQGRTSTTCRYQDENGDYIMDNVDGQDMMVWMHARPDRRPHQGESRRLRQRHRALPPRAAPRDQEGRGRHRPDVHLPRPGAERRASTCRTSARSTTTARARGAGSCAPTPPIRRSPRT